MQGRGPITVSDNRHLSSQFISNPDTFIALHACMQYKLHCHYIYTCLPHRIISIVIESGVHIRPWNVCLHVQRVVMNDIDKESQAWVAITIISIETVKPCYKLAALALPAMLWLWWLLLFSGDVQAFTRCIQVYGLAGLSRAFWWETCVKAGYCLDTCEREVIGYVSCSRMVNGDAWAAADQPNERVNGGG